MGQKDITEKALIQLNDVYANIVNNLVFERKQRVAENETIPENDMPLRVIGYDGTAYRDQIRYKTDSEGKRIKTVSCYPVITLVLYFGYNKHWDKAKTLHEALGDSLDDRIKALIPEYRINLYEIAYLTDEQLKGFKSDFRFVADYFVQIQRTGHYTGSKEEMKHVREVLQLMSVLTGDGRFVKMYDDSDWKKIRRT